MIQLPAEKQSSVNAIMSNTLEQIKEVLGMPVSITYKIKVNKISTEHVIQTVCKVCNTTWSSLIENSSRSEVSVPRQICIWFLSKYIGLSSVKIGKEFGRDHSTILYNLDRVKDMIDTGDQLYMKPINEIERCLLKLAE